MRYKGKLIMWNADKAFGFIQPIVGGAHVFIHKTALSNNKRTPQINDTIIYSTTKGKDGRYCASDASFLGEKLKDKKSQKNSKFSIYLSFVFLAVIAAAYFIGQFPQKLLFGYFGLPSLLISVA